MISALRGINEKLAADPKRILWLDGVGAFLTTFFLAAILAPFEEFFGMPRNAAFFLAMIAFAFTVFSFSAYFLAGKKWLFYLKMIRTANLIYCLISLGCVIYFYQRLKVAGLLYFILEILLVAMLVTIEYRLGRKMSEQPAIIRK